LNASNISVDQQSFGSRRGVLFVRFLGVFQGGLGLTVGDQLPDAGFGRIKGICGIPEWLRHGFPDNPSFSGVKTIMNDRVPVVTCPRFESAPASGTSRSRPRLRSETRS